jgi:CRP-like cAMP-binding protein
VDPSLTQAQVKYREVLLKSELFADLPALALDQLASAARTRTAQQSEIIFHQGDEAHLFFLVLTGRFRLVQHSADGKDVTMATFAPGDVIGLVVALTGEPYPGSGEALEDSEVLVLPGDTMWQMMNENARLAVRVLRLVAGHLHEAHNRIRELSAERVQQRIARSLLRLAQKVGVKEGGASGGSSDSLRLDMRLSRQDLAQMNGTTLETVSRTLTAWERDGIVQAGREQIRILKPHALVVIAEDLPH